MSVAETALMETDLADLAVSTFANATATHAGITVDVVIDRETPDVLTGARTGRWLMQLRAAALALSVGDQVTVAGRHAGTYRVLDVDEADGLVEIITLGAVA